MVCLRGLVSNSAFYWVWRQSDCRQDIWWDQMFSSNNKNKQRLTGKFMWLFYVFFHEVVFLLLLFFALGVLCKSVQTDNVRLQYFLRSFSNVFIKHQMYSRLYFAKAHLPALLSFTVVFTPYGGFLKSLVTKCFFVQSKSLRKGKKA